MLGTLFTIGAGCTWQKDTDQLTLCMQQRMHHFLELYQPLALIIYK